MRRSVVLYLMGEVNPLFSIEPGGYVSLWGVKGKVAPQYLELTNNHSDPMKIAAIDNDLPDRVGWDLEEIKPGFVYRLKIRDKSNTTGQYVGHLIVQVEFPVKKELIIIVNGDVHSDQR